jgi:putative transcriptional regulator
MVSRHPDIELLVEYTAGSLSTAPSISVTTHLQFCESCSRAVESLNQLGGDILEGADAVPVSEGLLEKILLGITADSCEPETARTPKSKAVDEVGGSLPRYVQQLLPEGKLRWRFLSPSLRLANISVGEDRHELALHRIQAGGKAPEHDHNGKEITVVLTGCFSDEDGVYQPGDFIVREPGDVHRPFAAQNEECICLSVLSAPIKLTGLKRMFNPFLGFSPG